MTATLLAGPELQFSKVQVIDFRRGRIPCISREVSNETIGNSYTYKHSQKNMISKFTTTDGRRKRYKLHVQSKTRKIKLVDIFFYNINIFALESIKKP